MGTTALGILNHLSATGPEQRNADPLKSPTNNAAGAGGTAPSGADAATITANDFLTLLVTEMKNQDPTANTDPNEYINQLVQVNSLQQLISINQTLIADSKGSPANAAAGDAGPRLHDGNLSASLARHPSAATTSLKASAAPGAYGNFTVPAPIPAAQRVAQSLGGVHPTA